jgi:hypothetical protein
MGVSAIELTPWTANVDQAYRTLYDASRPLYGRICESVRANPLLLKDVLDPRDQSSEVFAHMHRLLCFVYGMVDRKVLDSVLCCA